MANPNAVDHVELRWVEIVRVAYMLGLIDSIGLGSEGETLIRKRIRRISRCGRSHDGR